MTSLESIAIAPRKARLHGIPTIAACALKPSNTCPYPTRQLMQKKILIAGFQHETNTFAPTKASYENFLKGEGFPMLHRGAEVLQLKEVNISIGGFINAAAAEPYELIPVIWAGASPSAHVTDDAYARIAGEIIEATKATQPDAIYLDLHGAMVTESHDDGEGHLLATLRALVGPGVPIVASLDLHANVTAQMLQATDAMVAYRTYPHVDCDETGRRAFTLLDQLLRSGKPYASHSLRLPFLIPINGMCTMVDPAKALYAQLAELEKTNGVISLSFAPGFPAADFEECGPVVWGHGTSAAAIHAAVEALYAAVADNEAAWQVPMLSPDEAVLAAMASSEGASQPIVIADTQDNPGAGGDANTTGMLKALLRNRASNAAVGLIWDPEAAVAAHQAGVGGIIELALGGKSGVPGDTPYVGRFEVVHLSDGKMRYDGPMFNGMLAELGPTACLRIEGVDIAVSAGKAQMFDRNLYRIAGIVPEDKSILVNKSSVHFRADFQPIAKEILVAKAPGPMIADPAELPWTRLHQGIRTSPCGPAFGKA